jgi:hypothetical protein
MPNSRYLDSIETDTAVGPVDGDLGADVSRRVSVSRGGVAAPSAAKRIAFWPVGFLAVPALGIRPAGVPRIDRGQQFNAGDKFHFSNMEYCGVVANKKPGANTSMLVHSRPKGWDFLARSR